MSDAMSGKKARGKSADKLKLMCIVGEKYGRATAERLWQAVNEKLGGASPSRRTVYNFCAEKPTDGCTRKAVMGVLGVSFSEVERRSVHNETSTERLMHRIHSACSDAGCNSELRVKLGRLDWQVKPQTRSMYDILSVW